MTRRLLATLFGLAWRAVLLAVLVAYSTSPLGALGAEVNVVLPPGIRFSSLTATNGASYTGHTEGDFAVTASANNWFVSQVYGNGVPSIYDGPTGSPGVASLTISDSAGRFTLNSLDYSSNNGDSTFHIQGFLGASLQFDETGTLFGSFPPNFSFQTLVSSHSSTPIDGLVLNFNPGSGVTSINLDNIAVATVAVPEPACFGLLSAGLAALVVSRRARR